MRGKIATLFLFTLFFIGARHSSAAVIFDNTGGFTGSFAQSDVKNPPGQQMLGTEYTPSHNTNLGSIFFIPNSYQVGDSWVAYVYSITGGVATWVATSTPYIFTGSEGSGLTGIPTNIDFSPGVTLLSGQTYFLGYANNETHTGGTTDRVNLFNDGGSYPASPFRTAKISAGAYNIPFPSGIYSFMIGATDNGSFSECPTGLSSCIVDFTPEDSSTTTSPVTFTFHAHIAAADLGTFTGIYLFLHNIDQNVLLLSAWSPSDIYLINEQATTSGEFNFSTTTTLGDGNYRLEAKLTHSTFGISNPFSSANQDISHQFIVGEPTFIGNISQNSFNDLQEFYATSTATSSAALASSCSPLSFDVRNCFTFLVIPDAGYLNQSVNDLKTGVLNRPPWGYLTRMYDIWSSSATTSLPSFTAHIQIGPGDDMTPTTTSITIDPGDMMSGGAAILQSIHDPINGMTAKDVFTPFVQLTVALAVIFTIISDLTGSHKHHTNADTGENDNKKKLS